MAKEEPGDEPIQGRGDRDPAGSAAAGDPKAADPPAGDPAKGPDPSGDDGGVRDPHGQPGIAKGKYEREIAERDRRIAELEAQVAESAKTEEGRKGLADSIEALKAEMADKDVTHALEMAGCVNPKAAKAVLADFDGDVAKLREACPYLFRQAKPAAGATGFKPSGKPDVDDDELDRIFGLKK